MIMKSKLLLVLLATWMLASCTSSQQPTNEEINNPNNGSDEQASDTTFLARQQLNAQAQLASLYDLKKVVDSLMPFSGENVELLFEYYGLRDEPKVIPGSYYELGGDFKTFELVAYLELALGDSVVFEQVIKPSTFKDILSEELQKYGSLLFPSFRGLTPDSSEVAIHFSITVPATDIGKGVTFFVNSDGQYRIE